jgi:hypothetical protein
MTAGQQRGFGNPHAVFILSKIDFRQWNNHRGIKLTHAALSANHFTRHALVV